MPYTIPAAAELKTRYPAFASVADGLVDALIADASRFVDTTWLEADYQPAIMALAAHMLTMEGALNPNQPDKPGPITSEKLGDAQTSYANMANATQAGSGTDYGFTSYGRHFQRLQRVNVPGVLTV